MFAVVSTLLTIGQAPPPPTQAETLHRTVVTVHLDRPIGRISPYIYGTNDDRPQAWTESKRHTFGRIGGNRWTAYNWENNASNAGKDWHHQNDGFVSESNEPAKAVTDRLDVIQKHGAPALVTVPIQGWVAADKTGDGDVLKSGADFLSKRFLTSLDSNSRQASLQPNREDRFVFQNEFVAYLEARRKQRGAPPIWYSLDNEPDLWHDTHPRIQPHAPRRKELIDRSLLFAKAIKQEAPDALVFGPAVSGWMGITMGGVGTFDRERYFLEDYLEAFEAERTKSGKRLLDVLDVHWYPEHRSRGNVRITSDGDSPDVARARLDAVRSFTDEQFRENSWITRDVLREPIALLRRLNRIVRKYDSDVKLAITEYYFGGGADPSGAVAQADVLGVFGREGVFAANLFHMGRTDDRYILAVFDLYRNYDGQGASFGDTVLEVSSNSDQCGVYAAAGSGRSTIILTNRAEGWSIVNVRFVGKAPDLANVKRYQVAAPVARSVKVEAVYLDGLVLPPMSATLIVVPR